MRNDFTQAIKSNQALFNIELPDDAVEQLADFYELVQQHNPILHLVAPCSPEEFATRHILESLTLLEFLPRDSRLADVGAGAGLPAIPCLIARDDLSAVLIESKEKKASFLRMAVTELGLGSRTKVINKQFAEVTRPHVDSVTCRALDRFAQHLPKLLKWSGDRQLAFFAGPAMRDQMRELGLKVHEKLMPLSEQRYLLVVAARGSSPGPR